MTYDELVEKQIELGERVPPYPEGLGHRYWIRLYKNYRPTGSGPSPSCWGCVFFTYTPSKQGLSHGVCDLVNDYPDVCKKYDVCDYFEDNQSDRPERQVYLETHFPLTEWRDMTGKKEAL